MILYMLLMFQFWHRFVGLLKHKKNKWRHILAHKQGLNWQC